MTTYPLPANPLSALTRADGTTEAHSIDHGRIIGVWENVKHHGAKGDGSDDTAAIQAAIDALPASGGTLFVPGNFTCASSLNLSGRRGLIIRGRGGLSAGAAVSSSLIYTGTGSQFINAQNSYGVWFEDLMILYTNASFTGYVVDFRNVSGSDTAYGGMNRCYVAGSGVDTAAACVALDKAIIMALRDCSFGDADVGVLGKSIEASYSNRILIDGCRFTGNNVVHIKNPSEAWTVSSCQFNPIDSGAASAIAHDSGVLAESLNVQGCWFGDTTTGGTQILFGGSGLNVTGNYIGGNATSTGVGLDANGCVGVVIMGNTFDTHLYGFNPGVGGAGSHDSCYYLANKFVSVTNKFTGTFPAPGMRDDGSNVFTTSQWQIDAGAVVTNGLGVNGSVNFYTGPLQMTEIAAQNNAASNAALLWTQDNGAGKTQLMVRFATGAAQQLAIEP